MAEKRRPIHLAVAVSVSASLYAVSLAAVTGLQAAQNSQIDADHAPMVNAVAQLDAANNSLEARLGAAGTAFNVSASAFSAVADRVAKYEARLKVLAGTVATIQGSSISLPSSVALPRVSVSGSRPASKPTVHVTTTASGH
ncbi:MAG TPA: hypothetical protein VF323_00785 [Candidatus Limnocylindrales bacterium]